MSTLEEFSPIDATLVDGFQSGFPVTERPFQTVGDEFNKSEGRILSRVRRLHDRGVFRRLGPVLNPPVIGSSALAALSVPDDRFEEVATLVNEYDRVNHNYRRKHRFNLWFVVTAATLDGRRRILDEIADRTGLSVLRLPMRTQYYIDLEFPVVNDDRVARESIDSRPGVAEPTDISGEARTDLTALERRVILETQEGLPLSRTPYRDVADAVDAGVGDVLDAIDRLRNLGCIKRIGCVVNHHAVGFDENCMVVWDVPADKLDEWGKAAGQRPYVTYCCHRPRREAAGWQYNLFTMIHGRSSDAVDRSIDALESDVLPVDHARLHTVEALKQTGVTYRDLFDETPNPTTYSGA